MTKIFLVDDEPLVLIGMQGMLNWAELGYTVVGTARNGAEALKAIGETYPDIVVSDIRMPVMDGFTLAESCHKDGSALPVFIMLTSYEEFDYVKRSMRLGVVDYLVKIDLTAESLTAALTPALQATGQILYNYFSSQIYWAVGRAVPDILQISQSRQDALAAQQLLRSESPLAFYHEKPNTPLDHRAQVVAQVQQYIRAHLAEKLTLNDVAAVFNFSPNYLSQLFAQNSERGFVEYVTTARIAAAKELLAATDLKIYEVSSRVGFDSAFYFSKVFKKLEGASPREYIQRMKGSYVDAKDDAAL